MNRRTGQTGRRKPAPAAICLQRDDSGAVFSRCRAYRYALWRTWNPDCPKRIVYVGLNPSQADEHHNDATVRRCIGFAQGFGYGGLWLVNLFAYCATHPADLARAQVPIGSGNRRWLDAVISAAGHDDQLVAAWGNHGRLAGASSRFRARYLKDRSRNTDWYCFGTTQRAEPLHPLYLPADSRLGAYHAS